ncbi:hypothetical protein F1D05_18030 [Kribbella qitaiheensis]|uniref:MFS transporter n=1 Tax=Kribbella qitaiheensis TaxID=1544730 RepID=A0A7G6WZQ0_9ACTN|nr:hypothetical protein [Kribbella qitaiheensis]QNE19465.1 hypothetical protein F1D05_18030 [Kribbella qitaiheensis]
MPGPLAVAFAATAFTTRTAVLVALLAAAIFLVPSFNSGLFGYQVMVTPDGMQGRAQSAIWFLANTTSPLAPAIGGVLLGSAGARIALLVFAAVIALAAVLLTLSHAIRSIPLLSDVAAEQSA